MICNILQIKFFYQQINIVGTRFVAQAQDVGDLGLVNLVQ